MRNSKICNNSHFLQRLYEKLFSIFFSYFFSILMPVEAINPPQKYSVRYSRMILRGLIRPLGRLLLHTMGLSIMANCRVFAI